MESKVYAIVNPSLTAWFCRKCREPHNVLYKNGRQSYCYRCVPQEIKDKAEWVDQMGRPVERYDE